MIAFGWEGMKMLATIYRASLIERRRLIPFLSLPHRNPTAQRWPSVVLLLSVNIQPMLVNAKSGSVRITVHAKVLTMKSKHKLPSAPQPDYADILAKALWDRFWTNLSSDRWSVDDIAAEIRKARTAPQPDSTEQARKMVEAEFGTPLNSPMYQTAGRMIERLTKRIAAALDAARAGSLSEYVRGLEDAARIANKWQELSMFNDAAVSQAKFIEKDIRALIPAGSLSPKRD